MYVIADWCVCCWRLVVCVCVCVRVCVLHAEQTSIYETTRRVHVCCVHMYVSGRACVCVPERVCVHMQTGWMDEAECISPSGSPLRRSRDRDGKTERAREEEEEERDRKST